MAYPSTYINVDFFSRDDLRVPTLGSATAAACGIGLEEGGIVFAAVVFLVVVVVVVIRTLPDGLLWLLSAAALLFR